MTVEVDDFMLEVSETDLRRRRVTNTSHLWNSRALDHLSLTQQISVFLLTGA